VWSFERGAVDSVGFGNGVGYENANSFANEKVMNRAFSSSLPIIRVIMTCISLDKERHACILDTERRLSGLAKR